ncbi:disease resistance protein RGA2-like [Bidens hawaiensis]|uniref:disease resistance protein RGA2-like n=1 Tax=Bidens hawaiensis TaxID=980011 RepID=UPI00404B99E0
MEDVIVTALVREVIWRLTSEAISKCDPCWGIENQYLTLKRRFFQIQEVLHDAKDKRSKEQVVDSWLKSLRSASLMVENVLEDVSAQALLQRLDQKRGINYMVRAFFSIDQNHLIFRVRIAHKVRALKRKLEAIASQRFALSLIPGAVSNLDVEVADEMPDRQTSSFIHASLIFGRNEETEMVTKQICNEGARNYDNGEIQVFGILGMGGVGKTTLAQLVYNNERVNRFFNIKCWVCVSKNFQVKKLIKSIIESIDKRECGLTHLEVLQESLQTKLRGNRILIVLDDVRIEHVEKPKWDILVETLSCGAEGSIVVFTTRSQTTCQMLVKDPEFQHNMPPLSDEDSWLLFKKLAFAQRVEDKDISELEPIGREIVRKCKGLPLAVKTLGSLMWSKHSKRDWEDVNKSNIWELLKMQGLQDVQETEENEVFLALKFSYDGLLPHLKQCFAYCCLFPKGFDLEKDVVIELWVVSGFIPRRGDIDLYVLGEEIFDFLVWRSFFEVSENKNYSKDRYVIPYQMYDMARNVMVDDCFVIKDADKKVIIPNEALHLSSSSLDIQLSTQDLGRSTSLRSIFMFGAEFECNISQIFNHVYLRVLYLCGIGLGVLPESICKLKHLKYLNLSYSSIEVLPESIIYLQKLQVLLLIFCYELCKLPEGLRYMSSLRLLDISYCHSLLCLPSGIKELRSFRRLPRFHVGNKIGAKIGELGDLNLLEGELEISGLENVEDLEEVKSANLKDKRKLTCLKLSWSNMYMRESKRELQEYDKNVLERLEPDPSLKKLSIFFYMGKIISPSWILKLNNLVEIGFSGCKRCECIPPLGKLLSLKVIKLLGMDSLEGFHNDDMSEDTNMFPGLQELNIFICPNLVSLPPNLPKLKILKLEECGALSSLPDESFRNLNKIEITGCKKLSQKYGGDWSKFLI